eukprot:30735-Pelagococcus_subviridis.AAC.2
MPARAVWQSHMMCARTRLLWSCSSVDVESASSNRFDAVSKSSHASAFRPSLRRSRMISSPSTSDVGPFAAIRARSSRNGTSRTVSPSHKTPPPLPLPPTPPPAGCFLPSTTEHRSLFTDNISAASPWPCTPNGLINTAILPSELPTPCAYPSFPFASGRDASPAILTSCPRQLPASDAARSPSSSSRSPASGMTRHVSGSGAGASRVSGLDGGGVGRTRAPGPGPGPGPEAGAAAAADAPASLDPARRSSSAASSSSSSSPSSPFSGSTPAHASSTRCHASRSYTNILLSSSEKSGRGRRSNAFAAAVGHPPATIRGGTRASRRAHPHLRRGARVRLRREREERREEAGWDVHVRAPSTRREREASARRPLEMRSVARAVTKLRSVVRAADADQDLERRRLEVRQRSRARAAGAKIVAVALGQHRDGPPKRGSRRRVLGALAEGARGGVAVVSGASQQRVEIAQAGERRREVHLPGRGERLRDVEDATGGGRGRRHRRRRGGRASSRCDRRCQQKEDSIERKVEKLAPRRRRAASVQTGRFGRATVLVWGGSNSNKNRYNPTVRSETKPSHPPRLHPFEARASSRPLFVLSRRSRVLVLPAASKEKPKPRRAAPAERFNVPIDASPPRRSSHHNLLNETGVSLCTLQIVSPSKFPTDNTVSCGKSRSSVCGIELVTITSVNTPDPRRSTAGGEKMACVAHA